VPGAWRRAPNALTVLVYVANFLLNTETVLAFGRARVVWMAGGVGLFGRFGPNGAAWLVARTAGVAQKVQTGYLYSYALIMLLGLVAAISWVMVG